MKESNLAKAIDQAAEQRADKIIKAIRDSITKALEQHWRPKLAGEEFIGDDIRALLGKLSNRELIGDLCRLLFLANCLPHAELQSSTIF